VFASKKGESFSFLVSSNKEFKKKFLRFSPLTAVLPFSVDRLPLLVFNSSLCFPLTSDFPFVVTRGILFALLSPSLSDLRLGVFSTSEGVTLGVAEVLTATTGLDVEATDVPGMDDSDDVLDDRL